MSVVTAERLDLVLLTPAIMTALVEGRREQATRLAGLAFHDGWPDEHDARFLRFRLRQMAENPAHEPWLVRAMVLRDDPDRPMVGNIGFHGKPGTNARRDDAAVELGYSVLPEHRRRGYAEEANRALIRWARDEHGIRRFLASVSPDNGPSLALVRKLGFVEVGRHWDDEDGEELEFQLDVS